MLPAPSQAPWHQPEPGGTRRHQAAPHRHPMARPGPRRRLCGPHRGPGCMPICIPRDRMGLWPWERATPVFSCTGPRCWEEPRVRRGRSLKAGATDSSGCGGRSLGPPRPGPLPGNVSVPRSQTHRRPARGHRGLGTQLTLSALALRTCPGPARRTQAEAPSTRLLPAESGRRSRRSARHAPPYSDAKATGA